MKNANLFSFFCYSNSNKYANFLVYMQFNIIILAAPAEEINPEEIVDLIYGTEVPPSPGGHMAEEGLKAARAVLAEKKMAGATSPENS
jgi:hypothetical protein